MALEKKKIEKTVILSVLVKVEIPEDAVDDIAYIDNIISGLDYEIFSSDCKVVYTEIIDREIL